MNKNEERTMDEHELTPEEKAAFQRLPREAEPSRILEERIVRSLREDWLLRETVAESGATRPERIRRHARHGIWLRPWMLAGSVAASILLFASGVILGQWMGTESTSQAFMAVREQDATQLALQIQEAGSAYVAALAALGELGSGPRVGRAPESQTPPTETTLQEGREVALVALYGAAHELARMSPDDSDVLRVLTILEERRARNEGRGGEARNVVWF